ncbi:MAG: alpha/beta hydrolase [Dehalococcoidia bacterium]
MPTYQRGDASLYYEDAGGDRFPLLLIAPGGMNSAITFWSRMPFNPIEAFRDDFRVIAMDQRNCGQSTGPLDTQDPWTSYVDDQLGLLDHLGIDRYVALGCCIGCSYLLKQAERQPGRMVAGVLEQPIGLVETNTQVFQDNIWKPWGEDLVAKRDDLTTEQLLAFGNAMWHQDDFVFSVPKERIPSITTPMLVLTGADAAHPTAVSLEVDRLLPNSTRIDEWRPPEVVPQTVDAVRAFLQQHIQEATR